MTAKCTTVFGWTVADVNKFRRGENNDYDNDEEVSSDDSDYDRPDEQWHKQPKELSPPSRRELPLPRECQIHTHVVTDS